MSHTFAQTGASTSARALTRTGASILLVTDDPFIDRLCTSALQAAGVTLTRARHSGHALLACLAGPPVDLLIAELATPEGSGVALGERLRKRCPNMKTLFIGGAGTTYEAADVLVRPFTREDLAARVRAALDR